MKEIKIAHLTSAHPDGDVRIFHKQCVSLAEAGYKVFHVVRNTKSRIEKNVEIVSVNTGSLGRFKRFTLGVGTVYKTAIELNAEVYHLHDPELLRIAKKLKKRGKVVIYDAHEDLPRQILGKSYIPKFIRKVLSVIAEYFENRIVKKMDGVIAATPFIRDRFLKVNTNTIDINNYPILSELKLEFSKNKKVKNSICYVGNINVVRGIYELIESLPDTNARLILAGKFETEKIENEIKAKPGWKQVDFLGFVNREEVKEIYATAQLGIVTLHPIVNYLDSLPVKMFEYMAAGIPIIASNFPLWQKIIEENKCGICVDPLNPNAISDAVNFLLDNSELANEMGNNGKYMVEQKYNWNIEREKLIRFYSELII